MGAEGVLELVGALPLQFRHREEPGNSLADVLRVTESALRSVENIGCLGLHARLQQDRAYPGSRRHEPHRLQGLGLAVLALPFARALVHCALDLVTDSRDSVADSINDPKIHYVCQGRHSRPLPLRPHALRGAALRALIGALSLSLLPVVLAIGLVHSSLTS